ncbi:MAG: hypothetical protein QOJ99_751 [Bryobacterales bacterium]|nr:hypothetical protein [Bryobacterales bacterium]
MVDAATDRAPLLFKRLIEGTVLYSVALFAQRVAGLILLPVNTHFLSPGDYGVLDLLEQVGVVIGVLIGLNISAALGYFYFRQESPESRDKVVATILAGATLMGAAAGLAGAVFAGPIGRLVFSRPGYQGYLLFVFASLPLGALLEALFTWVRVTDRPAVYAWTSLLRVGITVVMTVTLVGFFRLRIIGVLTSSFVAMLGPVLFLGYYCLRRMRLTFDLPTFVAAFRFSFPLGLGTIAMFVINFGDRFFLSHYKTLTEVGIYAVAYKIGMLMSLVHGSFHTYWYSQVYAVARRDDADYVIARIFTYMMLALSFTLVALIVVCRPAVAVLVTRPGFETAAFVAPVIVLAYYARAIGDFFRCFLLVAGRSTYDAACNWIGAVICLAAYFILIPRYGMWGAAAATLLTFLVIAVVSAIWSYRIRPFRVEGARLFMIGAVSAVLLGLHFLIAVQTIVMQIAWAVLLTAAFPALLWVLPFARPGEVLKLQSLVRTALDRSRRVLGG